MTTPRGVVTLEQIQLERQVAVGGMGEVWYGVHLPTDSPVAVKRLQPGHTSREYRARLLREIQAFQLVEHEHIVRCLGSGFDDDDRPYLVLEWLEGETLAERWRRGPLALEQMIEVARQTLLGLAACHERGVVHRDIKPGNLFLERLPGGFRVKVLDLGLALFHDDASRLTRAGTILGTLCYLSPEQARGEKRIDHRADLYALGVVLYELTTGKLPFYSDSTVAVLLKIVTERPPRPSQIRPDLPDWLEGVILRAMERDAARRYASAHQMRADLERGDSTEDRTFVAAGRGLPLTASVECRLVCLLCVEPESPADDDVAAIAAAIDAAGGLVYRLLSGQTVGLFGLERTEGDEATRAVKAGIAVRQRTGARARLLVSTVRLEVGEGLQLDGEQLDRVASLASLPPGELVVDGPTREQLGEALQTETLDGQQVVRQLAEEGTARRRVLGMETELVGRESELAAVRAVWQRAARARQPEIVVVLGPAGIGKSRLCLELVPELRQQGALLLEAAFSRRGPAPYGLLTEAITRAAGIHVGQDATTRQQRLVAFLERCGARDEGTAAFIGDVIGVPSGGTAALRVAHAEPKVMRERVTGAFGELLRAAGERGPVALVLDDIHHADRESLALLEQLFDRLEHTPLFMLATARPELGERHPGVFTSVDATRVELQPLGRRALRQLLAALWGRFSRELEQLVVSWSAGNPYFAEELASWLVARGAVERAASGWELRERPAALQLPAGIQGAIQGRLDHLPSELKELLKAAAVMGEVFWEGACEAMGHADPGTKLHRLEADGFVVARPDTRIPDTREWAFRHALLHQVAAQMLPAERQRPLHLQVACWLETQEETDAALLAHHFEQAGETQRASRHYARAGAKALADGHPEQAVEWYRVASSVQPEALSVDERVQRTFGLARAYITLSRYTQASEVLDRFGPPESLSAAQRGELLLLTGRILLGTGQYPRAEDTLGQAIELLGRGKRAELRFDARHTLFWVIWVQGRYRDAGPIAAELLRESCAGNRADQLCSAKLALAYYCAVDGDLAASVRLAREAVEHAREIGHPYREVDSLTLLGSAQELVGLYDEALASLEAALALAERLGTTFQQASIRASQGRVVLTLGRVAEALDRYDAAVEKAETAGDHRTAIAALAGRARARAMPGAGCDLARAREDAEAALSRAADHALPSQAEARLALASVCLAAGESEAAARHALEAVALLDRLGTQERYEVEILLVAHRALIAASRTAEAHDLLERADAAIEKRAARIGDPALRESFLRRVTYNLEVKQLLGRA